MAPAPRVLYLGPKGKRSIEPCGMCQVWMPSNPTNIARKRVQEIVEMERFPFGPRYNTLGAGAISVQAKK